MRSFRDIRDRLEIYKRHMNRGSEESKRIIRRAIIELKWVLGEEAQ